MGAQIVNSLQCIRSLLSFRLAGVSFVQDTSEILPLE